MTSMVHSPARALDVGSVIAGTYTIEGLIGKGGMGAVFMASHARLPGKKVAIKVLHADVADGEAMARFKREAEIASRLGHPNIVEVHDWNELPDGTPYIVYELLHGESLADRLRRGPMGLEEATNILRQVGSALAAAHREGIVHRDLKPQNIFLVQADDGVSVKAKVLDFGISKIRGSTTVKTQDTAMLGTPQYMAPEQATGQHDAVDGRTDVFALAAVLYEMFAGIPAFQGTTIPEVVFKVVYEETPSLAERVPGLPPAVVTGIHRALAKKPAERWDDISAFVEAVTGSPLTTGKRSLVIPAAGGPVTGAGTGSGSPARTGQEAFAATMGSGDHASAMAASVRASMAAAATVAGTAQSGNGPTTLPPPIAATPHDARVITPMTTPHDAPAGTPPTSSKGRTMMIITITVVVMAAAVVAVVVMSGGGGGTRGSQIAAGTGSTAPDAVRTHGGGSDGSAGGGSGSTVAGSGSGSGTGSGGLAIRGSDDAIDAGHAGAPVDAAPAVAKPTIDAGSARTVPPDDKPGDKPGDKPDTDPDDADPELRSAIAEAKATLAAGNDYEALRLAKKITTKHPKAQAAWAIRATANCNLLDQETARADLRRVRRPVLVRAVKRACKAKGIEM
jgi:serine/threonine-protein kinase